MYGARKRGPGCGWGNVLFVAALCGLAGCSSDRGDYSAGMTPDPFGAAGTGGQPGGGTGAQAAPGSGGADAAGAGGVLVPGTGGDAGAGTGASAPGQPHMEEEPACVVPSPDAFQPNASVGGGGGVIAESDHFRIYGSAADADTALKHLEAAHKCFVEDWCFRSPGRPVLDDDAPYYKFNVYSVATLGGAAGVMQYDAGAGLSYLEVLAGSLPDPRVTIHEFGHALTLTEYGWVDQTRTGAWWETVANWVADTYRTSRHCEDARDAFGVAAGSSIIDLNRVIGQSHMMIVSDQNYYEAWPFLTYLTNNPDGYPGLGRMVVPNMFRNHAGNDETPLHVLERLASPVSVQAILGRYWARMAYLDIGHVRAQEAFFDQRGGLNFANMDAVGDGSYRVRANRRPAYGGANIIPLGGTGDVTVQVDNLGNGFPESNFTATLAIRAHDGSVRYVELPDGAGPATIGGGEEASLVVVNTPDTLYQYDAFRAGSPELVGLDYRVRITGATLTN